METKRMSKAAILSCAFLLVFGAVFLFAGQPAHAASNRITVGAANTGVVKMPVKGKYNLEARADRGKLKYKSSKPKVAAVSKKGQLKALKPGRTIITIKGKGRASARVTVIVLKKNKYKKVKGLQFDAPPEDMTVGDTVPVKVIRKPKNASNRNIKFKSSNTAVLTVNTAGDIHAVAPGTATVTVTSCANKKAKAKAVINVLEDVDRTVRFDSFGGSEVPEQTVRNGKTADEPEAPVLEDAEFRGWYLDGEGEAYDFSRPVKEDITLFARWELQRPDDHDGIVDAGDLARLEEAGQIQVMDNGDALSPRAIIGQFTDEKVNSTADARDVLMSMASLFNRAVDEEGNVVDTDFVVNEADITARRLTTPPDENGNRAEDEVLYRYAPTAENGARVEGGDIFLSTDVDGNVTGLNSTYNAAFWTLDPPNGAVGTSLFPYEDAARNYVMEQLGQDAVDAYGYEYLHDILHASSELIVRMGDEDVDDAGEKVQTAPYYAYKIHVTTLPSDEYAPQDPDQGGETLPVDDPSEGPSDTTGSIPAIDWVVYVDANTGAVTNGYDMISFADWTYDQVSLRMLNGASRDVDLRYRALEDQTVYEFYDRDRKLSVLPLNSTNRETRTAAAKFLTTPEEIATYHRTANTLMHHGQLAYDFWKNALGRDSYDGEGANLYFGYGDDGNGDSFKPPNAAWWGKTKKITFTTAANSIVYTRCLDVLGHELMHGVTDYQVGDPGDYGFDRSGESGSLDEAFSDIFGVLLEKYSGEGVTSDWTVGEDRGTDGKDNPLRSLADPTSIGSCKDHYDNYDMAGTNRAMYNNSTIFSHAFYLMATDSRVKSQMSLSSWAQLFYRAEARLSTNASFLNARDAVMLEAAQLKYSGWVQYVIAEAFDKVGIEDPKQVRLTLTWGSKANDLDLRLIGPFPNKATPYYEVYWNGRVVSHNHYSKKGQLLSKTILASLDQDSRQPNGTEVIKIHNLREGTYYCVVVDPNSDPDTLSKAQAHVNAFTDEDYERDYYYASDAKGSGWLACYITVDKDGKPTFWRRTNYYSDGSGSLYRYGPHGLMLRELYNRYTY